MLLAQTGNDLESIGTGFTLYFIIGILFCACGILLLYFLGWWLTNRPGSPSPYTGQTLRLGEEISYQSVCHVHDFLEEYSSHTGNELFDLTRASVCAQTGRVFPDSLTVFQVPKVKWNFLQKRYRGNYVSYGSLNESEKEKLFRKHHSLEGFQTMYSSKNPRPQDVETEFALRKPGPLYVDLATSVLIGWKEVPETGLEVLIVQHPKY